MHAVLVRLALGIVISLSLAAPAWAQATKTKTAIPKKSSAKVDLNTATVEELQELPGIGPVRAAEIVKARPFKNVAGLKALKGISDDVYEGLVPLVTVSEATPKKAATKGAAAKLDLNTATLDELQELPGIGPARAAEIVKGRPFKDVAGLKAVKGISANVYTELEPLVIVHDAASKPAATTKEAMPKTASKTAAKTTTKKAAAAAAAQEAEHEDQPQHLSKKKAALAEGRKINLNTATDAELQELPGIGPVRAAAIIKERPFEKIEDVMKVDGIKEGIFGHIKEHISTK